MDKKKRVTMVVSVVLGVVLVYFLATQVVPKMLVTLTKAAPVLKVSLGNSYFIGNKMLAKADGKDSCKVNVFVLNDSGKGIAGKRVTVEGVGIENMENVSGADGLASFEIKSNKEGQITLTAAIESIPLQKTIRVTFRND